MSLSVARESFGEWMILVYAPAPLILMRGKGSRLWDQQGKEYIDFMGGVAVNALGHAHPALREILNDQTDKFWYMGNGHTSGPVLRLAKKLINTTFVERIFFYNSDTEINEATLELARKYAHDRFGSQKSGIVAFKNAFHGRTLFTVSAGGQPAYSQDLAPLPPDIRHTVYDDLDPASQLIDNTTCTVTMESVQGEGGVISAAETFLQELRELCDRHNALLVFDEVQTGVGRTGELYAYIYYGVTPDLLMTAKALSDGFPIGALLATERCASVTAVDTHGTTYGGNLLVAVATGKLPGIANTSKVSNRVKQRHDWSVEHINAISEHFGLFNRTHGLGLLIGCVLSAEFAGRAKLIPQEAAVAGVMVLIAGTNVAHSAPALDVSEEEVTVGLDRFVLACERIKAGSLS